MTEPPSIPPRSDDSSRAKKSGDFGCASAPDSDMPMPFAQAAGTSAHDVRPTSPRPSFFRQAAQLVVIPALITLVCLGFFLMFGILAGKPNSIESQLSRLRQSSGSGRGPFGFQDPRYKDRMLAAANIAHRLPNITDPADQARYSAGLVEILQAHVGPEEDELRLYLLLAIGQLGQDKGLQVILEHGDSDRPKVLEGVVGGVLKWVEAQDIKRTRLAKNRTQVDSPLEEADRDRARGIHQALPALINVLTRGSSLVKAEAAAALGALAEPDDAPVISALSEAVTLMGSGNREVRWNAAVALARLGEVTGAGVVAELLLNRQGLARLPATEKGPHDQFMSLQMQSRVILTTLAAARHMTDPNVWDKIGDRIREVADSDPNLAVRAAAKNLLMNRARASTVLDDE